MSLPSLIIPFTFSWFLLSRPLSARLGLAATMTTFVLASSRLSRCVVFERDPSGLRGVIGVGGEVCSSCGILVCDTLSVEEMLSALMKFWGLMLDSASRLYDLTLKNATLSKMLLCTTESSKVVYGVHG